MVEFFTCNEGVHSSSLCFGSMSKLGNPKVREGDKPHSSEMQSSPLATFYILPLAQLLYIRIVFSSYTCYTTLLNGVCMEYTSEQKMYRNQIFRWRRIKERALQYKGGCCVSCGYNQHPAALQFHHKVPTEKEVTWTKLRLRSWDKIIEELDKCEILCANCHSILHSKSKYD